MSGNGSRLRNIIFLVVLAFCWGPSFFFIMIALEQWPPFILVCVRLLVAGFFLYLILRFQRQSLWQWRHLWHRFLIMGIFACALPFSLITYSELWITSSLVGIINSSPPIFTMILAHFFLKDEKLTWRKAIGIFIGVGGIVTVFMPSLLEHCGEREASALGIIFVTLASICYAIGMIYSRKYLTELPPLVGPTGQLLAGGFLLLPFAIFWDKAYNFPPTNGHTILALSGLILLGTVLGFILYYALIRSAGPTYLATGSLLYPFVALFFGVVCLKEVLHWTALIGCGLILIGLVVANHLIKKDDIIWLFGRRR